ncbi:hypothetical protein GF342_04695 [Candidatus Woesearchaeota archaeon]|nr:hypothetical protein [Candidatus Woesearchaeota archaeon]
MDPASKSQQMRATRNQMLEIHEHVRRLEHDLDDARAQLRRHLDTGLEELRRHPRRALDAFFSVFSAIPFPQEAAIERGRYLSSLTKFFHDEEKKGAEEGIPQGIWTTKHADEQGDHIPVHRLTAEQLLTVPQDPTHAVRAADIIIKGLAKVGEEYLRQLHQAQSISTDEEVGRMQNLLMAISPNIDSKGHFATAPPQQREAMYGQTIDQLNDAIARISQLEFIIGRTRTILHTEARRQGIELPSTTLVQAASIITAGSGSTPEHTRTQLLSQLETYKKLLPSQELLEAASDHDWQYRERFPTLGERPSRTLLCEAASAALDDLYMLIQITSNKNIADTEKNLERCIGTTDSTTARSRLDALANAKDQVQRQQNELSSAQERLLLQHYTIISTLNAGDSTPSRYERFREEINAFGADLLEDQPRGELSGRISFLRARIAELPHLQETTCAIKLAHLSLYGKDIIGTTIVEDPLLASIEAYEEQQAQYENDEQALAKPFRKGIWTTPEDMLSRLEEIDATGRGKTAAFHELLKSGKKPSLRKELREVQRLIEKKQEVQKEQQRIEELKKEFVAQYSGRLGPRDYDTLVTYINQRAPVIAELEECNREREQLRRRIHERGSQLFPGTFEPGRERQYWEKRVEHLQAMFGHIDSLQERVQEAENEYVRQVNDTLTTQTEHYEQAQKAVSVAQRAALQYEAVHRLSASYEANFGMDRRHIQTYLRKRRRIMRRALKKSKEMDAAEQEAYKAFSDIISELPEDQF